MKIIKALKIYTQHLHPSDINDEFFRTVETLFTYGFKPDIYKNDPEVIKSIWEHVTSSEYKGSYAFGNYELAKKLIDTLPPRFHSSAIFKHISDPAQKAINDILIKAGSNAEKSYGYEKHIASESEVETNLQMQKISDALLTTVSAPEEWKGYKDYYNLVDLLHWASKPKVSVEAISVMGFRKGDLVQDMDHYKLITCPFVEELIHQNDIFALKLSNKADIHIKTDDVVQFIASNNLDMKMKGALVDTYLGGQNSPVTIDLEGFGYYTTTENKALISLIKNFEQLKNDDYKALDFLVEYHCSYNNFSSNHKITVDSKYQCLAYNARVIKESAENLVGSGKANDETLNKVINHYAELQDQYKTLIGTSQDAFDIE